MADILLKPSFPPEPSETIELVDESTAVFRPMFGRAWAQRNSFSEPRWQLTRKYAARTGADAGQLLTFTQELRGALNTARVSPAWKQRGSFPSAEALTNNDFSNGVTGWSIMGSSDVVDETAQLVFISSLNQTGITPGGALTLTAYAPYVFRVAVLSMGFRSNGMQTQLQAGVTAFGIEYGADTTRVGTSFSKLTFYPYQSTPSYVNVEAPVSSILAMAGDTLAIPWVSLSRCFVVDAQPNLITYSTDITNATWIKTRSSTGAAVLGPYGSTDAIPLVEDATAGNSHLVQTANITVSASTTLDYCWCATLKANTRTFALLLMQESTGSTNIAASFNLSTGVVGTTSVGANWTNLRTFSVDLGAGWFRYYLIGRKTSAGTTINSRVYLENVDNGTVYNGDGVSSIYVHRCGLAQSAQPFLPGATTTTAASSGTVFPTADTTYVRGLPVSTNGLLAMGDFVEIDGQLKQLIASLSSDAAGMGFMHFRPAMHDPPPDGEPVIVNNPMGSFIMQEPGWESMYGGYLNTEFKFIEVY